MVDKARRYNRAAYVFVRKALDFALNRLGERRHVSGQELLAAISVLARRRFGPLTRTVFEQWGVRGTVDFGHIVFELIEKEVMSSRPEDSIEDFRGVYDFREEFENNYDFLASLRKSGELVSLTGDPDDPDSEAASPI